MQDITFTNSDLNDNKLFIQGVVVGGFAVEDNASQLIIPPQKRSGNGVEIDFSEFNVSGSWRIRFFRGDPGTNTSGGISSSEAMMYALLFG